LLHHAHELVAQGGALLHRRVAVVDVQVRPADGAEGHPYHGVTGAREDGLRYLPDPHLTDVVKGDGLHGRIVDAARRIPFRPW
jgi:hypothetical protein